MRTLPQKCKDFWKIKQRVPTIPQSIINIWEQFSPHCCGSWVLPGESLLRVDPLPLENTAQPAAWSLHTCELRRMLAITWLLFLLIH